MKLAYVYQVSKNMIPIKNSKNATSILYTDSYRSFSTLWGKCLKHIITYLYSTKYNEINICNLYIHENDFDKNGIKIISILYTGSHKSFPILCGDFSKCILLYLYCVNFNEIYIYHLGIQKQVSHEKWFKSYKYFLYRLS